MNYFLWFLTVIALSVWILGAWGFCRELREYLQRRRRDRD